MSSNPSPQFFSQPKEAKEYKFLLKGQDQFCVIKLVKKAEQIDSQSPIVLSNGFIDGYRDQEKLSPNQLGSDLHTWEDVEKFYKTYFEQEQQKFSNGVIHFWVEAFVDGKLVGWATFRCEASNNNAVYMELLVISPEYKGKGIGRQLVFSLIHLGKIPDLETINLDLRVLNKPGRKFYERLGFCPNPDYVSGPNAVESKFLEVYTWNKPRPLPQNIAAPQELDVRSLVPR